MGNSLLTSEGFIAGAYIIRNKQTSTVLHIEHPDAEMAFPLVKACNQDENQHKDQQVWWIEPFANHPGTVVYSITNPGTGKSLDMNPYSWECYAYQPHGERWQRWILTKLVDPDDGDISYNIINVFSEKALDIKGGNPGPGAQVHGWEYHPGYRQQCWELAVPASAFPAGWFTMKNIRTGHLLKQDYAHNAPALVSPPDAWIETQHREQWGFQWTLSHLRCFKSSATAEPNQWCIINRLTRSRLSPHVGGLEIQDFVNGDTDLSWKLQRDQSNNWRITNRKTLNLLQQENDEAGHAVICNQRRYVPNGCQTWILGSPMPSGVDAPPAYGSSCGGKP